jgi:hypothetical protein
MNKVREELERAHAEHVAAHGEPKKRRIRDWFRRQWMRHTSTSR